MNQPGYTKLPVLGCVTRRGASKRNPSVGVRLYCCTSRWRGMRRQFQTHCPPQQEHWWRRSQSQRLHCPRRRVHLSSESARAYKPSRTGSPPTPPSPTPRMRSLRPSAPGSTTMVQALCVAEGWRTLEGATPPSRTPSPSPPPDSRLFRRTAETPGAHHCLLCPALIPSPSSDPTAALTAHATARHPDESVVFAGLSP
ncbi:hypothetical protein B0H13DRAFT_2661313 [Mycena leptocephala]|nr:hypothetical protein B0H13DRAFT_2661313 [Mycena leptocephala]